MAPKESLDGSATSEPSVEKSPFDPAITKRLLDESIASLDALQAVLDEWYRVHDKIIDHLYGSDPDFDPGWYGSDPVFAPDWLQPEVRKLSNIFMAMPGRGDVVINTERIARGEYPG